jgi:hypothetical protein
MPDYELAQGKCKYLTYQRDCNDEICIVFCINCENKNDYEGNCNSDDCPIGFFNEVKDGS